MGCNNEKIQMHNDGSYFNCHNEYKNNPCNCGSNLFHLEYDTEEDNTCNSCNYQIYQVGKEFQEEDFKLGIWNPVEREFDNTKKYDEYTEIDNCLNNLENIKNNNKYKNIKNTIVNAINIIKEYAS